MAMDEKGLSADITSTRTESVVPTGCLACGILTGAVSSSVFTPFDRALYLSVTARRPLLDRRNWSRPYQGLLNTFTSRAINTGLYYPLESIFTNVLSALYTSAGVQNDTESEQRERNDARGARQAEGSRRDANRVSGPAKADETDTGLASAPPKWIFLASGQLVGLTSAVVCHPFNMVKCASWSGHTDTSSRVFLQSVCSGGVHQLYRGLGPTILREGTFGGIFSLLRHGFCFSKTSPHPDRPSFPAASPSGATASDTPTSSPPSSPPTGSLLQVCNPFIENFIAAAVGVVLSSPFNYARNMQLSAPLSSPTPTTWSTLCDLWREAFHPQSAPNGNEQSKLRSSRGAADRRGFSQPPKSSVGVSPSPKTAADAIPHDIQQKVPRFLVCHPTVRGVVIIADRLRVGWGTVRASIGMSIGAVVYGACMNHLVPQTGQTL
ncbi:putative mitochondrial carrier domain-containing protein [Neospora caninum Liverpool]|uniref:Mitochondrial carrier domain-containing protein,putative n=1 Tax=Neospora caninum (strain Liverpool) TaxID=572307 RepID=F0VEH6_NEOCL|nr:putative mitochondrial carrier domain-containing protein [Neospora caninum Liverpool]CBZ52120.1 putative mitochondrial carrier domain-containing protein [Neospora caninum Liverpool]CEL66082.1 TPA: mitochondrial carrier domain-containing protein,putative [Neospora caninum Liverpool]|eukprot:XP_003882152.1 putative mitochondrial carrier domain-containing protein [Neospora caninum Liverpool]